MNGTNIVTITERPLAYSRAHREAWEAGDKSLLSELCPVDEIMVNQPAKWFGEALVLRHNFEKGGWRGRISYAFFESEGAGSPRHQLGYEDVVRVVPHAQLEALRQVILARKVRHLGSGRPDLFLFRDSGKVKFKFVEVKMDGDTIGENQVRGIAEILAILDCPVEIVHLHEEGRTLSRRVHEFDLSPYLPRPSQES